MPAWCPDCAQPFGSMEALSLHSTGLLRPTRDCPKRCRTSDEMEKLGLVRMGPAEPWTVDDNVAQRLYVKRLRQRLG
jgi:hypothetical protein